MPVRLKCRTCGSTYNYVSASDARGAVCDCGGPLAQPTKRSSNEADQPAAKSKRKKKRSKPTDAEWTLVSDIAGYAMKASFVAAAVWVFSILLFLATQGRSGRGVIAFSGFALGLVFVVDAVCLTIIAISKFRIAGTIEAAIGAGTTAIPLGLIFVVLSIYAEVNEREARRVDMKNIVLGIENFCDVNRNLPSPASYDADGKPLLSWRVHLLPFIEQKPLYDRFRLDEPWDSPHNKELIKEIPKIYQGDDAPDGQTCFLLVVGGDSMFAGPAESQKDRLKGIGLFRRKELSGDKILIVEVPPDQSVIWTKPVDWDYSQDDALSKLGGFRKEGVMVGKCNGSRGGLPVEFISPDEEAANWLARLPLARKKDEQPKAQVIAKTQKVVEQPKPKVVVKKEDPVKPPSAQQLLDAQVEKIFKAYGGLENLRKDRLWQAETSYIRSKNSYTITETAQLPDRYRSEHVLLGLSKIEIHNNSKRWTSYVNKVTESKSDLDQLRKNVRFGPQRLLEIVDTDKRVQLIRGKTINGNETFGVLISGRGRNSSTWYFDEKTFLLLERVTKGTRLKTERFFNYATVDGIPYAQKIEVSHYPKNSTLDMTIQVKLTFPKMVDPKLFDPPAMPKKRRR